MEERHDSKNKANHASQETTSTKDHGISNQMLRQITKQMKEIKINEIADEKIQIIKVNEVINYVKTLDIVARQKVETEMMESIFEKELNRLKKVPKNTILHRFVIARHMRDKLHFKILFYLMHSMQLTK
jgi:hypothetical protein